MEDSKAVSDTFKTIDNEIKSELEAMTNLEYNVHGAVKTMGAGSEAPPVFVSKKGRAAGSGKRTEKMTGKSNEKMEPDSQIVTSLHNASIEELQRIIRQVALTSEDRYKVLEARDRLLRLKRVKSQSLATAKATSGTCPDMCPEKERLMRESQRQVAPYEQLESNEYRINHMIAVKQYSRSSADQEEPMAHDLRPVASLKMTMSYLLHEIVPLYQAEGANLGEWYHFLWDRTRGIRKDITQQELCCVDSVELVEQCARFHIVCSEMLCAEEASVFDKKINSENLTKCLQSLKYMYYDLRLKGIDCPNEPEFRAYVILLNLNNGNFMWDVQRLPLSIQRSHEVQFAIQVYNAIASNNYSKFFKLVRKTTYLNACILLRYFNQVRVNALSTMVKAYCRTVSTQYPLYELIDILGFEDESEAIYFCEQVGLSLSSNELSVMFNRRNFSLPESNIEQGRAQNTVESKRIAQKRSVAVCIAGSKLPDRTYVNHKPHNSFDAKGYLMPQSINAEDQGGPVISEYPSDTQDMETEDFPSDEVEHPKLRPRPTSRSQQLIHEEEQAYSSSSSSSSASAGEAENLDDNQMEEQSMKSDESNRTNLTKSFGAPSEPVTNKSSTRKDTDRSPFVFAPATTRASQDDDKTLISNERQKNNAQYPFVLKSTSSDERKPSVFSSTTMAKFGQSTNFSSFSKPSIFEQTQQTGQREVSAASPFSMVVNKSIFSGSGQSTLFAKPSSMPSIFGVNKGQSVSLPTKPETFAKNEESAKKINTEVVKLEEKIAERKKMEEEVESRRKIERIEKAAEQAVAAIQQEVIEEICASIVSKEIEKLRMFDRLSTNIADETLSRIVEEFCEALLKEELAKHTKLEAIVERSRNRMLIKYVGLWKRFALRKRRQREALNETPVWLQKRSVEELAKMLYRKEQNLVIENMRNKPYHPLPQGTGDANNLAPIEVVIHAGIKENLKSLDMDSPTNSLFFKLVISWPILENHPVLWRHRRIMNKYLCPNEDFAPSEPVVKVYQPCPYETLHVCISQVEGFVSEHRLVGTDALLFIAAASEDINNVTKRLTKTVLSRQKLMPIPLTFAVLGDDQAFQAHRESITSNLETLLDSGYISEYTITYEKRLSEKITLNLLQSSALWLAVNKSPSVPLEMDYLKDLYEACLTDELWLRIFDHSSYNTKLSDGLEKPDFIIDLHNEAVLHFTDIILDPESLMYTKFPPELKKFLKIPLTLPCGYEHFDDNWKNEEYRAKLEDAMNTFILPRWSSPWPITDAQTLHRSIMNYCKAALPNSNSVTISCDILSHLFLASGSLRIASFIDILLCIVQKKIRLLSEDLKVVYNKNHIKHFRTLPWWLKSNTFTALSSRGRKRDEEFRLTAEPPEKKCRTEIDEYHPLAEFCNETRTKILNVHSVSEELDSRLKAQQQQSDLLENKLREALLSNT